MAASDSAPSASASVDAQADAGTTTNSTRDGAKKRGSGSDRQRAGAESLSAVVSLVCLAAPTVLIAAMYWSTFLALARVWVIDPNYSHGFAVPFISGVIGYFALRQYGSPVRLEVQQSGFVVGATVLFVAFVLHVVASFAAILLFDVLALVLMLCGVLLVLGGWAALRNFGFAALFLVFMAPLPMAWYQPMAIAMQQIVSSVSTSILDLLSVPAYREGYLIHLPGYTMEVGEACSGLRQLTAVMALGAAIGYFSKRSWIYGATILLLAVPIAVFANCIRVVLTGGIMMLFGKEWAEGVFHTLEGLVIVGLAAALMVGAAWLVAKVEDRIRGRRSEKDSPPT